MPEWVLWLIVAAVLAAGEVLTLGFFLGPVAVAAVIAAAVAALGGGGEVQVASFIVAAVASLAFLRPVARRHLRTPAELRTGPAALIGQSGLVLERVDADGGRIKLAGEVWTARPFDEDQAYDAGVRVQVLKIEGATALVSE